MANLYISLFFLYMMSIVQNFQVGNKEVFVKIKLEKVSSDVKADIYIKNNSEIELYIPDYNQHKTQVYCDSNGRCDFNIFIGIYVPLNQIPPATLLEKFKTIKPGDSLIYRLKTVIDENIKKVDFGFHLDYIPNVTSNHIIMEDYSRGERVLDFYANDLIFR